MATSTSSPNVLDYTADVALIVGALNRIAVAQEDIAVSAAALAASVAGIAAHQSAIATAQASMAQSQSSLSSRAADSGLGIYTDSVDSEEARLSRAAIVNALRSTGQLADVAAEMTAPSGLPA